MKFLHVADLHIGKSLGDFDLIPDQKFILDQIIELAKKHSVDAVLVAGDVYDRSIPSEAAVHLFDYFIRRLAEEGLRTFLISGNHDSEERLNFGSSLFEAGGIYIAARYEGELFCLKTADDFGNLKIWLLPFVKASQVRHFFPEEEIANYEDAVRVVLKKAGVNPEERNILVAHQFVADSRDPVLSGSEGIAVQNVGLVEKIGCGCFDAFDYVALGHIHSAQGIGRAEVRYAGSPLKYSLSEVNHEKSVSIVTLAEKNRVQIEAVPLRPLRDLRHIRGRMGQLLAPEHITSPEDFIYVTLTDEDAIDEAMGIIRQYYPNTVRIEYDNSHTRELCEPEIVDEAEEVSFGALVSGFYRQIYGCEISDEEMRLMREAASEAGIEVGDEESGAATGNGKQESEAGAREPDEESRREEKEDGALGKAGGAN